MTENFEENGWFSTVKYVDKKHLLLQIHIMKRCWRCTL